MMNDREIDVKLYRYSESKGCDYIGKKVKKKHNKKMK